MRDEQLTANFRLSEFLASETADRLGIANMPNADELVNIRQTAARLQEVRDFLNDSLNEAVRIEITSGFRSEALNRAVGGSSTSDHRSGLAADFKALRADGRAVSPRVLIRVVEELGRFDQAILYPGQTRIHVGYGPRMRGATLTKTATGYVPGVEA
jgi:zinc D-Ala-D-Ala carboxypeptidase